ncbi:hypothetical protein G6F32_017269 [Rhizopus arrhizus]|nr:hypothetical protein G6F32_017269 [Rhizopus arrhizus]
MASSVTVTPAADKARRFASKRSRMHGSVSAQSLGRHTPARKSLRTGRRGSSRGSPVKARMNSAASSTLREIGPITSRTREYRRMPT